MLLPLLWVAFQVVKGDSGQCEDGGHCEDGGFLQLNHGATLGVLDKANYTIDLRSGCELSDIGIDVDVTEFLLGVDLDPLGWLTDENGSFVEEMIQKFISILPLNDLAGLVNPGSAITAKKCPLPLKPNTCYLGPAAKGWQDKFLPKKIPFSKQLKKLKDKLKKQNKKLTKLKGDTCLAANQDMFGIYDSGGFPSRDNYKSCMCPPGTPRLPKVVPCPVQILLKGFAFGYGGEEPLQLSPKQGKKLVIYDGFVQQTLPSSGDAWVAFDLVLAIPPLYTGKTCDLQKDARVKIDGVFFASYSAGEEVFQVIANNVDLQVPGILKKSKIGNGVMALRLSSKEEACRPTGFFAKFDGEKMKLKWDKKWRGILKDLKFDARFDFGVVTKDSSPRAFFIKVTIDDFKWLGFKIGLAQLELQFVTAEELERRRNVGKNCCGDPDSQVICPKETTEAAELSQLLLEENTEILALYFKAKDLSLYFGLLVFEDINVLFLARPVERQLTLKVGVKGRVRTLRGEGSITLTADLSDLGLLDKRKDVDDEEEDDEDDEEEDPSPFQADLDVSGLVNLGKNVVRGKFKGKSLIEGYDLLASKWDLSLSIPFKEPAWVGDLQDKLKGFWGDLQRTGRQVIDGIKRFAEDAWDTIRDIGKTLGPAFQAIVGKIQEDIEAVFDAAGDIFGEVEKAISGIADLFKSGSPSDFLKGLGAIGEDLLEGIGGELKELGDAIFEGGGFINDDVLNAFLDKAKKVSFEQIGDFIKNAFDKLKYEDPKVEDSGEKDEVYGCPILENTRKNRLTGKTSTFNPCKDSGRPDCTSFVDPDCIKDVAKNKLAPIQQKADEAKLCDDAKKDAEGAAFDADGQLPDVQIEVDPDAELVIDMPASDGNKPSYKVGLLPMGTTTANGDASVAVGPGDGEEDVNVEDPAQFEADLQKLMTKSVEKLGKKSSNGGSLAEKLEGLTQCTPVCNNPAVQLSPKGNFPVDVEVECTDPRANVDFVPTGGDFITLFPSFYDTVDLAIDSKCRNKRPKVECTFSSNAQNPCASGILTYNCFVTDCCGAKSNVLQQKLIIKKLPSKFTSSPGSLDLVLQDCASNIHPDAIGRPSFAAGCPGTELELTWNDEETFDDGSCNTTVVRTWSLIDVNCRAEGPADIFVQTIVLEHKENPLFETFPNDVNIDVFAPYGTDSAGFPTSYSVCSNPVTINYVDAMKEGSCFAERVIERTFTSQDVCGKTTSRTQRITIGTPPERLPLGPKSSYFLYAPNRFFAQSRPIMDYFTKPRVPRNCSVDAAICGGPSQVDSCNFNQDEFAGFEQFLVQIGEEASLDKGSLIKECRCPVGDGSCEILEGPGVLYGPRVIKSSGVCTSQAEQAAGINRGETLQKSPGIVLNGANEVYNFFTLDAQELANRTVAIQSPATSIVVTNLRGSVRARVAPNVRGIVLRNQISPRHILFNAPGNVSLTLRRFPLDREAYTFQGSLLDRRGRLNLFTGIRKSLQWIGQIYSTNLRARNVDLRCAHFAGFASCAEWRAEWPPSLLQLNTGKPSKERST